MPINISSSADKVTVVSIDNRARRNALTRDMVEALAALWPKLAADPTTRVVLLRGEGGAFCAGADLSAGLQDTPGINDLAAAALLKTGRFPKPIVAAITGSCAAGGLELALGTDIRVADADAKIGFPEVRWGIFPSGGGALKLVDQIGYANAMTLLLTGDLISGRRAGEIGLVSHVVQSADVERVAEGIAVAIARNSPRAVQSVKRYITEGRAGRYEAREAEERAIIQEIRASGQYDIGIRAFLGKTSPIYED